MRFGRRSKSRSFLGRKAQEKKEKAPLAVASEERNALLASDTTGDENVMANDTTPEIESPDPTQQLLTLLGRFQRFVATAEGGGAQEVWSDDCMDQLIRGVEISVGENWNDVVETLTDTARILQTYENEGRANECVPFLKESYELLCLMVGDLIVDNVRSGVIEKWRNLYQGAVQQAAVAGLTLVADEVDEAQISETGAEAGPASGEETSKIDVPFELADLALTDPTEGAAPFDLAPSDAREDEALPSLDELPPLEAAIDSGLDAALVSPDESAEEVVEIYEAAASEAQKEGAGEPVEQNETSDEIVATLDAICEELGRIEHAEASQRILGLDAIDDGLSTLKSYARERGETAAEQVCLKMAEMCFLATEEKGAVDDKFFELAFAFCGIFVEAGKEPDSIAVGNWNREVEALIGRWNTEEESAEEDVQEQEEAAEGLTLDEVPAEDAELETVQPEAVDVVETGSDVALEDTGPAQDTAPLPAAGQSEAEIAVASMFETARRAMASGDTGAAKLIALQVAANIANTEAERAAELVHSTEEQLKEEGRAIGIAHEVVIQVEGGVTEAEELVVEGQCSLEACQAQSGTVESELQEAVGRIDDLDEQIRALQDKRGEECAQADEIRGNLDQQKESEQKANDDLEALKQDEHNARSALEDARQQVKRLERKRAEMEVTVDKARDTHTRQRGSVADIEQTISHIESMEPDGDGESAELLF